jgi:hypothetical protein
MIMDRREIYIIKQDIVHCVKTLIGWEEQAKKYQTWALEEEHRLQGLIHELERKSVEFALQEAKSKEDKETDHG